MQFQWSPALWALASVPGLLVLYVWMQTRRRKYAPRYSSLSLVRPALDRRSAWRRHIPPALFFGGLAVMVVALARPTAVIRAPVQQGVVILALDTSLSMRSSDVEPNRFIAALAAARKFVDTRPDGAQVGIVAFAGNAAIVQQATDNKEDLDAALDTLNLQRGTAIGSAILESLDAISMAFQNTPALRGDVPAPPTGSAPGSSSGALQPQAVPTLAPVPPGTYIPAIIILLTDGQNRNGPDPVEIAKDAAARGVRIYTIGVGTAQGVPLGGGTGNNNPGNGNFGNRSFGNRGFGGFEAGLDEQTLRLIAQETGGDYFYAKDATDLQRIYGDLSLNLVLKQFKSELTVWFTAAAALLLLGAFGLGIWWSTLN